MLFSPSASRQYFLTGKSSILVKINIFSLVHFLETANQYCIGCVYLYFDTVGRSSGRASAPQKLPLAVPRGFPRKICGEPWGAGIRGLTRGLATLPCGATRNFLLLKDTDGRSPRGPPGGTLLLYVRKWCTVGTGSSP